MLNRDKPRAVVSLRVNGVPATPQSAGNFQPGHHLSSAEFAWQLMKKERNSPLTKSLFGCRHEVPEFTVNDGCALSLFSTSPIPLIIGSNAINKENDLILTICYSTRSSQILDYCWLTSFCGVVLGYWQQHVT
jgi:hypothetical protein